MATSTRVTLNLAELDTIIAAIINVDHCLAKKLAKAKVGLEPIAASKVSGWRAELLEDNSAPKNNAITMSDEAIVNAIMSRVINGTDTEEDAIMYKKLTGMEL
jgi:hypothetical protein